jgi:farnesyl diphosphate synthase
MHFATYLEQRQQRINAALLTRLPNPNTDPYHLHEAMTYAVLNGGKRIRPLLVYATGETLGAPLEALDPVACALEYIHAYSLIHDDLPAMDDDDLRRGKPTCHKAFDEATAILAGDALQTLAFHTLSQTPAEHISADICLKMIQHLSFASGSYGMAGGQALDLKATGKNLEIEELEKIHRLKTGALIRASIYLAGLAANSNEQILTVLDEFAHRIGLAFQIQDDILDIESSTSVLGKQQGADLIHKKATYPAIVGISAAKAKVKDLYQIALANMEILMPSCKENLLSNLIQYIIQREY